MIYKTSRAYELDETTNTYEKTYVITHKDAIFVSDNEDKTLGTKLTEMESETISNSNKIGDLSGNGLTEIDLATAIKNDRSQLSDMENNKVDKVTGKGLSTNDYDNTEKAEVAKIKNKADTTYVDTKVAGAVSGAPKAVSLVANMTDTTKNYVYTGTENGYTAGNWYYYNGSAWVSGGVYQSTGIADKSINLNSLDDFIQAEYILSTRFLKFTVETGYFYKTDGSKNADSSYSLIKYDVSQYDKVYIRIDKGAKYTSAYTLTDGVGTVLTTKAVGSADVSTVTYTIDVSKATYLIISVYNSEMHTSCRPYLRDIVQDDYVTVKKLSNTLKDLVTFSAYSEASISSESGFYGANGTIDSSSSNTIYKFDTSSIDFLNVSGTFQQYQIPCLVFDNSDNILRVIYFSGSTTYSVMNFDVDTHDASYIKICVPNSYASSLVVKKYVAKTNYWKGKKIVWFGTSIPAGGLRGNGNVKSYPIIIGNLLGATVYNEAFGSSGVMCKYPDLINATTNPYGFVGDFERSSRCLTNTIDEMNWIITNKDSSIWTTRTHPATLESWETYNIRDGSYQNKLDRYLEGENPPNGGYVGNVDLYIFDHGHNDDMNANYDTLKATYGEFNKYSFRGAMNFLIDYIKQKNPFARIVMVGEYENQKSPTIATKQMEVATDWSIPIFKRWEYLGWSQRKLTTTGYWNSNGDGTYTWIVSGGASQEITYLNLWCPDGVHPHSDASGKSTMFNATCIANWLKSIGGNTQ